MSETSRPVDLILTQEGAKKLAKMIGEPSVIGAELARIKNQGSSLQAPVEPGKEQKAAATKQLKRLTANTTFTAKCQIALATVLKKDVSEFAQFGKPKRKSHSSPPQTDPPPQPKTALRTSHEFPDSIPDDELGTLLRRLIHNLAEIGEIQMERSGLSAIVNFSGPGFLGLQGPTVVQTGVESHSTLQIASYTDELAGRSIPSDRLGNAEQLNWLRFDQRHKRGPSKNPILLKTKNPSKRSLLHVVTIGPSTAADWLAKSPPLFARYFPQQAARRPDADGFSGRRWNAVLEEFKRLNKSTWTDLRIERLGQRLAEDGSESLRVELPAVFVPQAFSSLPEGSGGTHDLQFLIDARKPVTLLGDPGSGKSTVLCALALASAGFHPIEGTILPQRLPILLPLRKFSRGMSSRPHLLDAVVQHAKDLGMADGDAHRWFFQGLFEMGEAILLLDGLDEAGDKQTRRKVVNQIHEFHRRYPLCPVWVSSRKVGYSDAPLDTTIFQGFTVAPFDKYRRDRFVTRWYADEYQTEPQRTSTFATSLIQAFDRASADVQRMAANPLLLTLMALIHRSKNHHLPNNRGELYEECVELLLDRWEKSKFEVGETDPDFTLEKLHPKINRDNLRSYFSTIAFEIQLQNERKNETEWGRIPRDFLASRLTKLRQADRFDSHPGQAASDVEFLLNYIRLRSGLLVWNGGEDYAFWHLSFQEYLAACHRKDGNFLYLDQCEFFREKVHEPKWRETLVLLLYKYRGSKTTDLKSFSTLLVEYLLGHATGLEPAQASGVWRTLGMALRDEIQFTPTHQRLILDRLLEDWLKSPQFEGETFAILGDLFIFCPDLHPLLMEALQKPWADSNSKTAFHALHLRVRLAGWPSEPAHGAAFAEEITQRLGLLQENRGLDDRHRIACHILGEAERLMLENSESGKRCLAALSQKVLGGLTDSNQTTTDRAASGALLAILGDPRAGVWVRQAPGKESVPDVEWCGRLGVIQGILKEGNAYPSGGFLMGGDSEAYGSSDNSFECTRVKHPFYMSRYPVTVRQYQTFVEGGGYGEGSTRPEWWSEEGWRWRNGEAGKDVPDWYREIYQKLKFPVMSPETYAAEFQIGNHPQVGVSWYEATAFCEWLNQVDRLKAMGIPKGWRLRLASDAEWELAARWESQADKVSRRRYAWGDPESKQALEDQLAARCNCKHTGLGHSTPVGLFPNGSSGSGLMDITGNVWEWCQSRWMPVSNSKEQSSYNREKKLDEEGGNDARVLRGGSWLSARPSGLSLACRGDFLPGGRNDDVGFRLVCVSVEVS